MRTAIVVDWLVTVGGAEKVLQSLIRCYPDADLFALIDFIPKDKRRFLQDKKTQTSFLQKIPKIKQYYRHFLPLMPLAIEQFDLSHYDLVISSSHAVAKGVITSPDQLHISYVHSPMRYAWDLQQQYLVRTGLDKKWVGMAARYFLHKLRLWDYRSAQSVDYFLANSNFIARRIKKNYRRDAHVIYPPIATDRFIPGSKKENFYLTASRFVPYKRIDLIVECFSKLKNKQLYVIGDGPEMKKIRAKTGPNVHLLGYQPTDVLISYLQKAQAFIFAAEEDFGLLPLEAQSCGTPVIVYGKGGALETVHDLNTKTPTGVFFKNQTVEHLIDGINEFEKNAAYFTVEHCRNNALRFATPHFESAIKEFISEKMHAILPPLSENRSQRTRP